MRLATLQRAGGASLIAGSALLAAYSVLFSALLPVAEIQHDFTRLVAHPSWIGIAAVALAGVILMMFGFAAVYTRLHAGAGSSGFIGFVLVELAYLLQASKVTWEIFLYPVIVGHAGSATLLRDRIIQQTPLVIGFKGAASATIFAGVLLLCLALVRSREFPRSGGVLVFSGALLYGLGPVIGIVPAIAGIVVHAAGCLILGVALIRPRASPKYVLFYESADDVLGKAPLHYPAHRARVDAFHTRGALPMIGLFAAPQEGAMAVFATREAAEEFAAGDPFVLNGVVRRWQVKEWNEIYG